MKPDREYTNNVKESGFALIRCKNHLVYERVVVNKTGKTLTQKLTVPKTVSDHRAYKNNMSILRKLNEERVEWESSSK